ncbi:hypothetical protein HPP92_012161 [Vanilla planifolia]|uniref:Uncharacterized protein n=1 Tax=Vanilla planifolia TaxID=51239 RepID=A0A835R0G1_VANPL|nr:hypothetical protein HPP92_012161 [Vanilla planifolia]
MTRFKINDSNGQISFGQPAQATFVPCWVGSQSAYGEPFSHFTLSGDRSNVDSSLTGASFQVQHAVPLRMGTGMAIAPKTCEGADSVKFATITDKESEKWKENQQIYTRQTSKDYHGCFELGLGQSVVCSNYPCVDQCYGLFFLHIRLKECTAECSYLQPPPPTYPST